MVQIMEVVIKFVQHHLVLSGVSAKLDISVLLFSLQNALVIF